MRPLPDKRILPFLDRGGKVCQLPAKGEKKHLVLKYLSSFFEPGVFYTEKEVNALLDEHHSFGDYFLLRRELVDGGLMRRTANGARYWMAEQECKQ